MNVDFKQRLANLGLSQADFIRVIEDLSGKTITPQTVCRWGIHREPPALAIALLTLLERTSWRPHKTRKPTKNKNQPLIKYIA